MIPRNNTLKRNVRKEKNIKLGRKEEASVLYHSIFRYPLTKRDLKKWKVSNIESEKYKVKSQSIKKKGGYYYLSGNEKDIFRRIDNEVNYKEKFAIAQKYVKVISYNPFVIMIALTGALSMNNASFSSDIDLMMVTRANTLWISRLSIWIILKLLNAPIREPNNKNEKNKLCINIWLEENKLSWPKNQRNVFTAHEILQVKPLFERGDIYNRFISENEWVDNFWERREQIRPISKNKNILRSMIDLLIGVGIYPVNFLAYLVQLVYMRNKRTREDVSLGRALFHPNDISAYVIKGLEKYKY